MRHADSHHQGLAIKHPDHLDMLFTFKLSIDRSHGGLIGLQPNSHGSCGLMAYLYDKVGAGSHTSIKSAIRAIMTFASTKSISCKAR